MGGASCTSGSAGKALPPLAQREVRPVEGGWYSPPVLEPRLGEGHEVGPQLLLEPGSEGDPMNAE